MPNFKTDTYLEKIIAEAGGGSAFADPTGEVYKALMSPDGRDMIEQYELMSKLITHVKIIKENNSGLKEWVHELRESVAISPFRHFQIWERIRGIVDTENRNPLELLLSSLKRATSLEQYKELKHKVFLAYSSLDTLFMYVSALSKIMPSFLEKEGLKSSYASVDTFANEAYHFICKVQGHIPKTDPKVLTRRGESEAESANELSFQYAVFATGEMQPTLSIDKSAVTNHSKKNGIKELYRYRVADVLACRDVVHKNIQDIVELLENTGKGNSSENGRGKWTTFYSVVRHPFSHGLF